MGACSQRFFITDFRMVVEISRLSGGKVPRPTLTDVVFWGVEEGSNLCMPFFLPMSLSCVKRRGKATFDSNIILYYVEPEW